MKINILGVIIGILSSMLGIGGGIIFAPVLFIILICNKQLFYILLL